MAELTIKRWRKYGNDRLYVTCPERGTRIGSVDLKTGARTVDVVERSIEFATAVDLWLVAEGVALPAAIAPGGAAEVRAVVTSPDTVPVVVPAFPLLPPTATPPAVTASTDDVAAVTWTDLATHRQANSSPPKPPNSGRKHRSARFSHGSSVFTTTSGHTGWALAVKRSCEETRRSPRRLAVPAFGAGRRRELRHRPCRHRTGRRPPTSGPSTVNASCDG